MKPFRFIHASDLHLDAPFRGISAEEKSIASALQEATFRAYENLIKLCDEKEVDFLVIAGDVYNSTDRSIKAQLRFRDGLAELAHNNIQSFVAHGNHDPIQDWISSISWPEGVHVFGCKEVDQFTVQVDKEQAVQVFGMSYATKQEKRNLVKKYRPSEHADLFKIGVLHCNCGGQLGHDPYVPCTVKQLSDVGIEYWALGHVHERLVLSVDPHVIYPGNTQGLSIREKGERGCYVIDVNEYGEISLEFYPLDVIRWKAFEVDIENFQTLDTLDSFLTQALESLPEQEDGRSIICRVRLVGSGPLYPDLTREGAVTDMLSRTRETVSRLDPFVHVEKIENTCRPEIDVEKRREEGDLLGELLKFSEEIRNAASIRRELEGCLSELFENPRMRKSLSLASLEDAELENILENAERLCIDLLED